MLRRDARQAQTHGCLGGVEELIYVDIGFRDVWGLGWGSEDRYHYRLIIGV